MASQGYHDSNAELGAETRDMPGAIASLMDKELRDALFKTGEIGHG